MTDKTGYPIQVGSHVRADETVPGFSKNHPGGVVERMETDVLWVRTHRGLRALRPSEVEVARMSYQKAKRPVWVKQVARTEIFSQKPRVRR